MKLSKENTNNYVIIRLEGSVEGIGDVKAFREMMTASAEGAHSIAICFEKADALTSDFINIIMASHIALKKKEKEVCLIGSNPAISETLSIVGVPMIMTIHPDYSSFKKTLVNKNNP